MTKYFKKKRNSIFLIIVALALIFAIGILSSLSIDDSSTKDSTIDNENDNSADKTAHNYMITCEHCKKNENYLYLTKMSVSIEDYGSIGKTFYNLNCGYCGESTSGVVLNIRHSYINGSCVALGCTQKCDHTFTGDAISYVVPNDERFSMFDSTTLSPGDSAGYSNGTEINCTICGKNLE